MSEFNIWDNSRRKVVCTRNDKNEMMVSSENNHLLEVGKEYTVADVEVHSWHTLVWLEEFSGIAFNSVLFDEKEIKPTATCKDCLQYPCEHTNESLETCDEFEWW